MGVSLERFQQLADSTFFSSRDIVVRQDSARLGNFIFSSGKAINDSTMKAFRTALSEKYGTLGEHAFDTVLGSRTQFHKSLRACDIKATISQLSALKEKRLTSEIGRQLNTHPKMLELSPALQQKVSDYLDRQKFSSLTLNDCKTAENISRIAHEKIDEAIAILREHGGIPEKDLRIQTIGKRESVETPAKPDEPTGLKNLSVFFDRESTSIEDKVKQGTIGVGMRINQASPNPVLLEKLKTNGVEPGFIYKNDWSPEDTRGMMMDFESKESKAQLAQLKEKHPDIAAQCDKLPLREQIMLFGREHPAALSAVAEYVVEKGMQDESSAIYAAFCDKFPGTPPEQWKSMERDAIKAELFVPIRDAIMHATDAKEAEKSPIFKHFTERHIVKLDYNEGNRIRPGKTASAGKFMRPERIVVGRKLGQIYRLQTATTADKASVGAVTEALANDLTRLAGIPSQELTIVRGQYSDGHPKLMLEAKFAEGYKDMEEGFLKDGQVAPDKRESLESLGKYKAFFLVTADRDGVGSRGQNKGFAKGQFFAIDPGHSLEGNGRFLEVDDNFSFKDTYGFSLKPRFNNFSVFDDDTRFAKFQGALNLRTLKESGKIKDLFDSYEKAFNPNEQGISPEESALRGKIQVGLAEKKKEFEDSLAKVLTVAENQLKLYDDLAADGLEMQKNAIETIENLEKLTSPTTWVSPKKEVALKHLSVLPETRKPWRAHVDNDNIVYHCDEPLPQDARDRLDTFAAKAGLSVAWDSEGCPTLTIAKKLAEKAFSTFSEDAVAKATHPTEAAARERGLTGLDEARREAQGPVRPNQEPARPPVNFPLPETLNVVVGAKTVTLRKQHYEAMLERTPAAERPRNLAEFQSILASRIQRGMDIAKAVLEGNGHRYAASTRNVACLTLAFHAATAAQNEYNERGAFSVADPDGKLYQWLDTSKDLYLRTSTHARAYQNMTVDGHKNMPRGLDIPEGMGGLMGGMRTLHYMALPEANGQPRRLFLKCETYGIFRSTISKEQEETSRSVGMQTRHARSGDTLESLKHCFSLATVFTRRGPSEGNRKENFPSELKLALQEEQNNLRRAGHQDLATSLGKDVGGGMNGGIRVLVDNLATVFNSANGDTTILDAANRLLSKIITYAETRVGEGTARLGNEVMLDLAHGI
ncbi:MAG: hypothetical protein IJU76_05965 [Desulfovibrionaceae bacterium]|nr:hypothetical protein [Desulfovibrionaceae bacterium]